MVLQALKAENLKEHLERELHSNQGRWHLLQALVAGRTEHFDWSLVVELENLDQRAGIHYFESHLEQPHWDDCYGWLAVEGKRTNPVVCQEMIGVTAVRLHSGKHWMKATLVTLIQMCRERHRVWQMGKYQDSDWCHLVGYLKKTIHPD